MRGPGLVVVLAYHSVTHLRSDGLLAPYSVTPKELASHLDFLAHEGYRFIDLGELCEALGGAMPLPERGVLLSFDDCYENLRSEALPVLAQRGVPAVTFAVSGRLGGTNDWDRHLGGGNLRLLDADGLREVTQRGIEVGAHSRTHPVLTGVGDTDLLNEVAGSAADLEAVGLPRPRAFAYPYGVSDARVMEAVRKAGYEAAFATAPGVVSQGSDRHGLPRIELSSGDSTLRLRIKLANAAAPSLVRQRFARTVWPTEERWSARFARLLLGRSLAGRLGRLLAHRGAGVGSSTRGPHEPGHPASAP